MSRCSFDFHGECDPCVLDARHTGLHRCKHERARREEAADQSTRADDIRAVQARAVDVVLDHLDPPSHRLGRTDWCMNAAKIVRALQERGLLAERLLDHEVQTQRSADA